MKLEEIESLLNSKTPKEFFGDNPEKTFRDYSVFCHPDHNDNEEARKIWSMLKGSYDSLNAKVTIRSENHSYSIFLANKIQGDASDVYVNEDKVVKISNGKFKSYFQKDRETLDILRKNDEFSIYFPKPIELFEIKKRNYAGQLCSTFENEREYISLRDVYTKYGKLQLDDFGWMFNRLLESLGHVHRSGYIHGCVIPEHFLVCLDTHHGKLIDFKHSVKIGEKVKLGSRLAKPYYPREIIDKEICYPESDIYMAGHIGLMMVDQKFDKAIDFFYSMMYNKASYRPNDAWKLRSEFGELLKFYFGKPKFKEFNYGTQ